MQVFKELVRPPQNTRIIASAILLLLSGCCTNTSNIGVAQAKIDGEKDVRFGQVELYDIAYFESQLSMLSAQLSPSAMINQSALSGAAGNIQGGTLSQNQFGLQLINPVSASAASSSNIPSNPATTGSLPPVSPDSFTLLAQQLQTSEQMLNYNMMLKGSKQAQYSSGGKQHDKIVLGIPISILPTSGDKNKILQVEVEYYPPKLGESHTTSDDQPSTVINLMPAEHSYNSIAVSSTATNIGLGTLIGTVSLGLNNTNSNAKQFLIAQQDTLSYQEGNINGNSSNCKNESGTTGSIAPHFDNGVKFGWQFRPVLGQDYVRPGLRTMFAQLSVPNIPDSNRSVVRISDGGTVCIKSTWIPFYNPSNSSETNAILAKATPAEGSNIQLEEKSVIGDIFNKPQIESYKINELGNGNILVTLYGGYLSGCKIRVGSTILDTTSPGFMATNGVIKFSTTLSALAAGPINIISSNGSEFEIYRSYISIKVGTLDEPHVENCSSKEISTIKIVHVDLLPSANDRGIIRVEASGDTTTYCELPLVLSIAGGIYGPVGEQLKRQANGNTTYYEVSVANADLKANPVLKLQRLMGNPYFDSLPVTILVPETLTVGSKPKPEHAYTITGAAFSSDKAQEKKASSCQFNLKKGGQYINHLEVITNSKNGCDQLTINNYPLSSECCDIAENFTVRVPDANNTTSSSVDPLKAVVTPAGSKTIPNFSMDRAVVTAYENHGTATLGISISKLKDASVTLTLSGADILSATDGASNKLTVSGHKVTITTNSDVTFQISNWAKANGTGAITGKVIITAEGKGSNGNSTGKLQFSDPFTIITTK